MIDDDDPRPNSPEDIGGPYGWKRPTEQRRPPTTPTPRRETTTMAAAPTEDPTPKEGPRGLAVLFQQVHDGELHSEASLELQKLVQQLQAHATKFQSAAKGRLTLTLNLTAQGDTIEVVGDVKVVAPKSRRARSVFWGTKGGNLSVENPRQTKLPLREVPTFNETPRDVGTPAAAPRSV